MGMRVNTKVEGESAEIRRIRREIERAENEGDADAFGTHFADNVVQLPVEMPTATGAEAVVEFHRELYNTYDIDIEFTIDDITILGDLAVEHGTYTATLTPTDGDDPEDAGGDYLYVFERNSAGAWKITRMSWA